MEFVGLKNPALKVALLDSKVSGSVRNVVIFVVAEMTIFKQKQQINKRVKIGGVAIRVSLVMASFPNAQLHEAMSNEICLQIHYLVNSQPCKI